MGQGCCRDSIKASSWSLMHWCIGGVKPVICQEPCRRTRADHCEGVSHKARAGGGYPSVGGSFLFLLTRVPLRSSRGGGFVWGSRENDDHWRCGHRRNRVDLDLEIRVLPRNDGNSKTRLERATEDKTGQKGPHPVPGHGSKESGSRSVVVIPEIRQGQGEILV